MEEQSSRAEERCGNIGGNGEVGDRAINGATSNQIGKAAKGRSFGNICGGEHGAGLNSDVNNGKNDSSSSIGSSSFECNICLETAADPVVTLCGHLFCWSCVYRWFRTSHTCPVCKAPAKEDALIPLYGRGSTKPEPRNIKIPNRPTPTPTPVIHTTSTDGYMSHQPYPYPSPFAQHGFNTGLHCAPGYELFPFFAFHGSSVGQILPHRQNRHHRAFLHKVSVFLSCFVFVCLLSF